jgi:hypothetical protein
MPIWENKMKKTCVIFSASVKRDILEAFDRTVDENNYIVEKSNPTQKVLSPDGGEIKLEDFAGISKGSLVFIKKDLPSIIELTDKLANDQ